MLKTTRFVNLSLMGLGTGISFSHFLQWRRKAELPGEVLVRVQKTLYNDYGPTGAIMEPGELLSTLATLALVRKRRIQTVLASVALSRFYVEEHLEDLFEEEPSGAENGDAGASLPTAKDEALLAENAAGGDWISRTGRLRREVKGT